MPVDFMWMKLSDQKGLPFDEGATSVKAKLTETIFTPKIGYRFIDTKKVKVDALFGIRYWHLSTTFTLQPTQIANGFSQSANWVDGLGGGKIELGLTPKLSATILGDAGRGSARSDYQVAGLLGYKLNPKFVLLAGYRYLDVDYRPTGKPLFIYDVAMPGLVLGLTINVK
jgi:outer membrane receptor protein involved in Fe transport